MINEAFYEAPGGQIKFSKTSNPLTWIMYTVSTCLGSATFRSKITSYGNFRYNCLFRLSFNEWQETKF